MQPQIFCKLSRDWKPELEARVGPCEPELGRRLGRSDPNPLVDTRALLDTARSITSVRRDILESLGVIANARVAGRDLYCVSMVLLSLDEQRMVIRSWAAASHTRKESGYGLLLGADFVRGVKIHIDGETRGFDIEAVQLRTDR